MTTIKYLAAGALLSLPLAGMQAQSRLYPNEFDLQDVTLLESPFRHALDLNTKVLLSYDTDRLLAPYFKAAGLEPKGESFANWDGLDGHVGGHYVSALAMHWAATGDPALKERLDYVVSQLALCAAANNDGYLGGVPNGNVLWPEIKAGNVGRIWDWWVPWYNVHKMYAGLRDAYVYAGSKPALNMFLNFCDWGVDLVSQLTDAQMESMLGNEFGGMNEVFADAYALTGERKYLETARKFTHHNIFDPLAAGRDELDNKHANTQVPKVIGFQRVAELSGDDSYGDASRFFWQTVTGERSLSFGGNSRREHFASAADAKSYVDDREGPESCNTNNMLKLTEGLFRMEPSAQYADFYERALYNHILSTQHPEHGGYVYFTSARPGHYRVYSQPNQAMWCCVGTGMENHGKYGQFIYTHTGDSLQVNLFIPSELDWKAQGVKVRQTNRFPVEEGTSLTVATDGPKEFTLQVRKPGWCDRPVLKVNGQTLKLAPRGDGYYDVTRTWNDGDRVDLETPMHVELEELNHLPQYVSIVRGPIVLAGRYDGPQGLDGLVAGDHRWGHIAHGELVSVFDTPLLTGDRKALTRKLNAMKPNPARPGTFIASGIFTGTDGDVVLEPFSGLHDSRYMVYWLSMSDKEWKKYEAGARREESRRLALDARTVDAVNTGEQQPEADHGMKQRNSGSGNFNGEPWRDAGPGGHFAYTLDTGGNEDLQLRVRYWGNETGAKRFNIVVDGETLTTVDNSGRWGVNEFREEEYGIPPRMLAGKQRVDIRFEPAEGNSTAGIYHLRLVKIKD